MNKKLLLIIMAIAMCFTATRANEIIGNFEYNVTNNVAWGIPCALLVGPSQAFVNSNPTSISVPGYITTSSGTKLPVYVSSYAFSGGNFPNVTNVWVSYGAIGIGYRALASLPKLSTVHIPSSVKGLGNEFLYSSGGSASGSTLTVNWATLNPGSVEVNDNSFSGCSASYKRVRLPTSPAINKANNISILTTYFNVINSPYPTDCYDYLGYTNDYYIVTKAATSSSNGELSLIGCLQSNLVINQSTSYSINGSTYIPTSVVEQAFYGNTSIQSVGINKSNFTIESNAFAYCTNLTFASLSTSQIKEDAFRYCSNLSTIYLNEGVKYVAPRAFTNCSMSTLHIPATLETFSVNAVDLCYNLEQFTVASTSNYYSTYNNYGILFTRGLKTLVKVPAKGNCPNEGYWPSQLTTISDYAFSDQRNIYSVKLPYGVTTIGSHAFMYATSVRGIKIPSSATSIDYSYAFYGCSNLKRILIATPENCTSVNFNTFQGVPSSMKVYLPSYWFSETMNHSYFIEPFMNNNYWNKYSITYGAWDVLINGFPYSIESWIPDHGYPDQHAAFLVYGVDVYDANTDISQTFSGAITIPETFTHLNKTFRVEVAPYAFKGNTKITNVILNGRFFSSEEAFRNCTGLTSISFNTVWSTQSYISGHCFQNTRISYADLPYGIRGLGPYAFADNPNLQRIHIPSSCNGNSYCGNFMRNCPSLTHISINMGCESFYFDSELWGDEYNDVAPGSSNGGCFYNIPRNCKVYIPVGEWEYYYNEETRNGYFPWRYFNKLEAGASDYNELTVTKQNNDGSFDAKYVYVPNNGITQAKLGENEYVTDSYNRRYYIKALGDSCFAGSTSLQKVEIDWSDNVIKEIPEYAFYKCANLKKFQWPNKLCRLKDIGKYAFAWSGIEGVVDLTKCNYPVLNIREYAFNDCKKVTHFKLSANTYQLGQCAMYQSSGALLTDVTCLAEIPPTDLGSKVWNSSLQPSQTLHVPIYSINGYKAAAQWKKFGHIVAEGGIPGDVNSDGIVSSVDVTILYNYLLNGTTEGMIYGDQDGDGIITSVDVTIIYNILLGN